jgi:hypothetical protein
LATRQRRCRVKDDFLIYYTSGWLYRREAAFNFLSMEPNNLRNPSFATSVTDSPGDTVICAGTTPSAEWPYAPAAGAIGWRKGKRLRKRSTADSSPQSDNS